MCEMPQFSHEEIKYALFHSRLRKITRNFLYFYFTRVRIIQVKYIKEPIPGKGYISEPCECRLSMKNCANRLDTCFKKKKHGDNIEQKLKELQHESLVRTVVNTGNFHFEICHCCWCCCFPIIIYNLTGFGILPSGYFPEKKDDLCNNCKVCLHSCPFLAINPDLTVDLSKCLGCGLCEMKCPSSAIKMVKMKEITPFIPNKLISFIFLFLFVQYVKIIHRISHLKPNESWEI